MASAEDPAQSVDIPEDNDLVGLKGSALYRDEKDETGEEAVVDKAYNIETSIKPRKYAFKLKRSNDGNILTVHHTVKADAGKLLRIRLGVCCFSERGTHFVAIDKRGNLFVFDLCSKRHWCLASIVPKASVIKASIHNANHYLVGTKLGQFMLLDLDKSRILQAVLVSSNPITEISFPGQPLQPSRLVLINAGHEAIMINLDTLTATHRLDFDEVHISMKFASYLPQSEQIFTCFTNDSVHVWSGVTLNTLRIAQPIKARDRRLRLTGVDSVPEVALEPPNPNEFQFSCRDQDYANGLIVGYCCMPDGSLICLSTLDNYLLLLSPYTFQLERMVRLRDFVLTECVFLPQPKETLILGLNTVGQVVLLDCQNVEFKMILQPVPLARHISISLDGKLLAVLAENGEANLWSICRLYNAIKSKQQCMQMLKGAFKQRKPVAPSTDNECFNKEIKKLLKRDRLLAILQEYGCYPAKYRSLIWCTLLQLPCNRQEFQQLLKLGMQPVLKRQAAKFRLKNDSLQRALLKIWSCLSHWCKVFAYSQYLPHLIFPFVKLFPKNTLVTFEICVTLLQNHFQLWFEFHPMAPANYLGLCENTLQHFDPELCKFYASMQVTPTDYAWSLLSNAFSEVFDEEQWLCLWDHIMSSPPYLPIFCAIAYNLVQREIVRRLPHKEAIVQFFQDQNAVDICKVISKAHKLMKNCPEPLHPKRYMKVFQAIPKNVYPKFLNYPREFVAQHEVTVAALQQEHRAIDTRIRQLELEEFNMMERLENGLKEEEHAKRIKDMEKLYKDTLKREEERIACQRKMLLLYQKEIRSRKGEVYATLQEVERRKKALQMEQDVDKLRDSIECERLRNDNNLLLAEDEIRNQDLELMAQNYFVNAQTQPLAQKYNANLQRLNQERALLGSSIRQITLEPHVDKATSGTLTNLDDIEQQINDIQKQFMCLTR